MVLLGLADADLLDIYDKDEVVPLEMLPDYIKLSLDVEGTL